MDDNTTKKTRNHLTLVPPPVPANAAELDAINTKKALSLNDAVQPIFRSLWDQSDEFRALNTGVDNATAVHGKLDFDDYVAIQMIQHEAQRIGQTFVSGANAKDIRSALLVVRNRYHLGRNSRKAKAVEVALLSQRAAE